MDHPYVDANDAEVRTVREMLRRLLERDPRPFNVTRPCEHRMTYSCRHYALLAVSIFRHHPVPSRVRVGFATYFTKGFYEDHWVCEYWDGAAWRLLDAELGAEAMAEELAIDFSSVNVPRDPAQTFVRLYLLRSALIYNAPDLAPMLRRLVESPNLKLTS